MKNKVKHHENTRVRRIGVKSKYDKNEARNKKIILNRRKFKNPILLLFC